MNADKISVVIPTCDRPTYLYEAVQSVLTQTLAAHEILVVDNGRHPVDDTALPTSKGFRLIRTLPRFGVAQARNFGAVLATGNLIAFLDDDDRWDPEYLESALYTHRETGANIILGGLRDAASDTPLMGKQASFNSQSNLISQILRRNPGTGGSNVVIEKSLFCSSAGYDPWLTTHEDKALVLDLMLNGGLTARAEGAWVEVRNDGEGPRLTENRKRAQGKIRFLKKYWSKMKWGDRLFNIAQLARLYFPFKKL